MCILCPCSSTRAKLCETEEGLIKAKRGSQVERKRQSPQEKWNDYEEFNFYRGKTKWFRSVTFADNTHEPGSEVLLDCSRSQVCRIQEGMSSTCTAKMRTRGMVIYMLGGREMCIDSAVIHKANVQ